MTARWWVPYEEGAGSNVVRGRMGPFATKSEAHVAVARMVDRYPYWVPDEAERSPADSSCEPG